MDLLLLLSAFCLFLPYARAALQDEPLPGARAFYKKRLVRITALLLPVRAAGVFPLLAAAQRYWTAGAAWKDLLRR